MLSTFKRQILLIIHIKDNKLEATMKDVGGFNKFVKLERIEKLWTTVSCNIYSIKKVTS